VPQTYWPTTICGNSEHYIIHPAFSLARLHYDRNAGIVTYDPRPFSHSIGLAAATERFSPLETLAALTAFIPEKGPQVVRYCGYYSNKARGQRRLKQQCAAGITPVVASPPEPEPDDFRRHARRAWARLIRKVWESLTNCTRYSRYARFLSHYPPVPPMVRPGV
jgi:hypothetical protein